MYMLLFVMAQFHQGHGRLPSAAGTELEQLLRHMETRFA